MTVAEFAMHRPKLARDLDRMAADGGYEIRSVLPENETPGEMFSALLENSDGGHIAVCVSGTHPAAMREEEAPGTPTWWWEDDLRELGY